MRVGGLGHPLGAMHMVAGGYSHFVVGSFLARKAVCGQNGCLHASREC